MARPKTVQSPINALVAEFASQLGATIERFVAARIEAVQPAQTKGRRRSSPRRQRAQKLCYFPGCKNVAAPRFGMFCAAEHKDLPQRKKDELRAQRQ